MNRLERMNFDCENFYDWMMAEIDKQKELFAIKHDQYSTMDPLANFRTSALAKYHNDSYVQMFGEAKNFAMKHIAHIINNDVDGPKVDESLGDIAIYCLIMKYMVTAHKINDVEK